MPLLSVTIGLALVAHAGFVDVRHVVAARTGAPGVVSISAPRPASAPEYREQVQTSSPGAPAVGGARTGSPIPVLPRPRSYPWWFGVGPLVIAATLVGLLIWKIDDFENWQTILIISLIAIFLFGSGVVAGFSFGQERGIDDGARWVNAGVRDSVASATFRAAQAPSAVLARTVDARGIVMIGLGLGAIWFFVLVVRGMGNSAFLVESHWGGFGGGVGGWRVAPSLIYLIVAASLVAMLVALTPSGTPPPTTTSAGRDTTHLTKPDTTHR